MTVRTYWTWDTTATLRLLGGARGGHGRGGAGHIVSPRAQLVVFGRLNSRVLLLMFVSLLLYDLCSVLTADVSNNQWNCATNICVSIDDSLVVGKSQIKS